MSQGLSVHERIYLEESRSMGLQESGGINSSPHESDWEYWLNSSKHLYFQKNLPQNK